ncbi:hypothetical protein TPR58_20400 [Sphingomonas sp. HF-S3]|uniref:Lipoprotein n=1 Tax=Sphingomonas rustica TaxID=3103142 RepID=A0ABV0BHI8_9SPHN
MIRWLVLAGALGLSGCQPPGFDIRAVASGGRLAFEASEDRMVGAFSIRSQAGIIWSIHAKDGCTERPYPVRYGQLPSDCYVQDVAPVPLRPGRLYRVEDDQIGDGRGLFVIERDLSVTIFDSDDRWQESNAWDARVSEVPEVENRKAGVVR